MLSGIPLSFRTAWPTHASGRKLLVAQIKLRLLRLNLGITNWTEIKNCFSVKYSSMLLLCWCKQNSSRTWYELRWPIECKTRCPGGDIRWPGTKGECANGISGCLGNIFTLVFHVFQIYEGTAQIQRLIISREWLNKCKESGALWIQGHLKSSWYFLTVRFCNNNAQIWFLYKI